MWKTTILQHGDEFSFDSSTFLEHWCPENTVKQRFHDQNVRQFYVFGTLMSGKQSKTTISRYQSKKERKKKRRKWCAGQAKLDFETFYEKSKNRASAIGVSENTFLYKKSKWFKYQKRRFRLRGVSKSSRSEVIKKSIQNEVDQSKSSELAETSENSKKSNIKKIQKLEIKKEDFSWEGSSFLGRQRGEQNRNQKIRNRQTCDRGQRFCDFCWR